MTSLAPPSAIDFEGRDPGETFQFYFRQHWIRMLWPFCQALLLTLLLLGAGWTLYLIPTGGASGRHLLLAFLLFFFLLVQFEFLLRFYRHFLYVVIVTDRGIHRVKKTLLTVDERESVDLGVLQEIHKRQRGVFQNVFRFGTLSLEAQDTRMRLHFTPRVADCYREIMRLREHARLLLPKAMD